MSALPKKRKIEVALDSSPDPSFLPPAYSPVPAAPAFPPPLPSDSSSAPLSLNFTPIEQSVDRALNTLKLSHPNGFRQSDISSLVPQLAAKDLMAVLNRFIGLNRVNLYQDSTGETLFKVLTAEEAEKYRDLSASDLLILQLIGREGSMGLWIRDLRRKSSLQPAQIQKSLKLLQTRKLIKCEKSIEGKNKKVYMLYELEPAKEIKGGSWYTGSEFDEEFIQALEKAVLSFIPKVRPATATSINAMIQQSGIFNVACGTDEIDHILQTLKYDGFVEIQYSEAQIRAIQQNPKGKRTFRSSELEYRLVKGGPLVSKFTEIPCSVCPVVEKCAPGNPVSPEGCKYFKQWMEF